MYTPVEARIAFSDTVFLTVTCVQRCVRHSRAGRLLFSLAGARAPAPRGAAGGVSVSRGSERAPAAAARARVVS